MAVRILSLLQTTCRSSAWSVTPSHGGSFSTRGHPMGKYISKGTIQPIGRRGLSPLLLGLPQSQAPFIWSLDNFRGFS